MPSEDLRLHDEEIKSAVEYERDSIVKDSGSTLGSTKASSEDGEDLFDLKSR